MTESKLSAYEAPPAAAPGPAFSYAFQPIVNTLTRRVTSYEALIRGANAQPAWWVLEQVGEDDKFAFDAFSREAAMMLAGRLGLPCRINLNCLPRSFTDPEYMVRRTLDVAEAAGLPMSAIILEVTENEVISDAKAFTAAVQAYRRAGVAIAIDDFGAGYSGLNLLVDFQPEMIKLDMHLIRGIHEHGPRQAIVRGVVQTCTDLGIDVVAEGVETLEELRCCEAMDIELFQGYLFAKPGFECFPEVRFP